MHVMYLDEEAGPLFPTWPKLCRVLPHAGFALQDCCSLQFVYVLNIQWFNTTF